MLSDYFRRARIDSFTKIYSGRCIQRLRVCAKEIYEFYATIEFKMYNLEI